MNINDYMKVSNKYGICPNCKDDTIGNGSKFIIEDNTFVRSCRVCGFEVQGHIDENNELVEDKILNHLKKNKNIKSP